MSKYLDMLLESSMLVDKINDIVEKTAGKKVLIYGVGLAFDEFNKRFNLNERLNIVAYSDKKFEIKNTKIVFGKPAIKPNDIPQLDFDYVVITIEQSKKVANFLKNSFNIDEEKIIKIVEETIQDEAISYNYMQEFNFAKNLKNLNKKMKNKRVVLYGAGVFLEAIKKYYDLSQLNIVGISDKRFSTHEDDETFLGYKVYSLDEVEELEPDYLLVSTKFYIKIIEDMYYKHFRNKKTKIKPLLKKPFFNLLDEIWW